MAVVFISPQTWSSPRAGPPFPAAAQAAAVCPASTTGCQSLSWAWSCALGRGAAGGPASLTFHSKALSPAPGPKLILSVYCLYRHPDPFSQELWETVPFVLILQMGNQGSRASGDLPKAEPRPESCVFSPMSPNCLSSSGKNMLRRTRGYDWDGQGQRGGGLRFLLDLMEGALAQIPVTQTEADGGLQWAELFSKAGVSSYCQSHSPLRGTLISANKTQLVPTTDL